MNDYKQEKLFTISYRSRFQNYTLGYKTLDEAIKKADELNRPVLDENKRVVYTPIQTKEN